MKQATPEDRSDPVPGDKGWGLEIGPVSEEIFRDFAKRFADSPEVGPIATRLDAGAQPGGAVEQVLIGLRGCGRLCAVACCEIYQSKVEPAARVVKLDSVISDPSLRRRGLAGLLVAQTFHDLVTDVRQGIVRIYAHSVHPATVRMLRQLSFNDPPVTGAPISHCGLEGEGRAALLQSCEDQLRDQLALKRLQCEFCRTKSRRSRPWCLPRGG